MTAAELLAGLDDRFQLLAGGRRRQRQRTLEAMLDWSYDLVEPAEQAVFRALGVFVDGFDLDAAAALAAVGRAGCRSRHAQADRQHPGLLRGGCGSNPDDAVPQARLTRLTVGSAADALGELGERRSAALA